MQRKKNLDLHSPEAIRPFVDLFYQRLLTDKTLSPIFLDVAKVDLEIHKPIICEYWEKLLFGSEQYQRHTMNIHRAVNNKRQFKAEDFLNWYGHFELTMDELYQGPMAEKAKRVALTIARNMNKSFGCSSDNF